MHPDLSFDARRVGFAFCDHTPADPNLRQFFLWEVGIDGQGLRQLTGEVSDRLANDFNALYAEYLFRAKGTAGDWLSYEVPGPAAGQSRTLLEYECAVPTGNRFLKLLWSGPAELDRVEIYYK